jgi:hypothetical protein
MRRVAPREQKILFATALIVSLALLEMLVLRPCYQKMKTVRSKLAGTERELRRMREVSGQKNGMTLAYEEIRSRITSKKTPEREIISMLLNIEKAALDSGVEIVQNAHVKDEPFPYFSKHTVEFRGRGNMQSLTRMLWTLQDPQLLLKIPEMQFSIRNHQLEMDLVITRIVCPQAQSNG